MHIQYYLNKKKYEDTRMEQNLTQVFNTVNKESYTEQEKLWRVGIHFTNKM